jgi:citrate lyase subunit beta/citryl-CoA lyase
VEDRLGEDVKFTRSLLFVPAHRGSWVDKAIRSGADALILDLEDSVPEDTKEQARDTVVTSIKNLRDQATGVGVYLRLNSLDTGLAGDDLEQVAIEGVDGFVLPKTYDARDVIAFDALVSHFERRNGVPAGRLEFILSLETAEAYAHCEQMAVASPRVAALFAGTARDADVARSIGFQFTTVGTETLYLRSRAVLAARAAGLPYPLVGVWQDLADLAGARQFAQDNRQLGFRGQVLIHPAHVAIANEVFSPSAAEVEFYAGMVKAFDAAVTGGAAAIDYEGQHVDYAHIKTAKQVLDLHDQITGEK